MPDKLYYGINEIPKGYVLATLEQAINARQVRYYGLTAIDKTFIADHKQAKNNTPEKEREKLIYRTTELKAKLKRMDNDGPALKKKIGKMPDSPEKDKLNKELTKSREEYKKWLLNWKSYNPD